MKTLRMLMALAVAAPLAAQQPDSARKPAMPMGQGMMGPGTMHGDMMQGGMMGMPEMMGPMMRGMAFSPAKLLMHKDALTLTDQQVAKLTAIRDAAQTAHDAAMSEMRSHMQMMTPMMTANAPDTTQLRPHFQEMMAAMSKAHWAMLSASAQARAALTDIQRARVEGWADAMQQMMPMRQ